MIQDIGFRLTLGAFARLSIIMGVRQRDGRSGEDQKRFGRQER